LLHQRPSAVQTAVQNWFSKSETGATPVPRHSSIFLHS
jgi:hypothetical protein